MQDGLLQFLNNASGSQIGDAFIAVMLIAFLAAVWAITGRRHERFEAFAPSLLTTLGILGTFVGICIGLANFDVNNIDGSIPTLLEGLKTAFVTSVVGMTLSVVTKALSTWVERDAAHVEEVTPEVIHRALLSIEGRINDGNAIQERTRLTIAGDGDASVVTQLQKIRTQMQDDAGAIRKLLVAPDTGESVGKQVSQLQSQITEMGQLVAAEFRAFAVQVSEIGSKQLVKALEEVIRDFNAKLSEQFGENFKRLDESVKELVTWQLQHRDQVEQLTEHFKQALKGILITRDALTVVAEKAATIPPTMEKLETVVRTTRAQLDDLERHLAAFAELKDRAVTALPEIQRHVADLVEQMRQSVKKASDHYEIMLTDIAGVQKKFADKAETVAGELDAGGKRIRSAVESGAVAAEGALEEAQKALDRLSADMSTAIQKSFEQQNGRVQQLVGGLREAVDRAASDQTQLIRALSDVLDKGMQTHLERALNRLGNNLASITAKFADDYKGLVAQMQRVVDQTRSLS